MRKCKKVSADAECEDCRSRGRCKAFHDYAHIIAMTKALNGIPKVEIDDNGTIWERN
jgi:molybdopterin synthase catalytic subunit